MKSFPFGPRRSGWALAALLVLFASDARALCTVTCSCAVSITNVTFGTINPLSLGNTDSAGNVAVTCSGVLGLLIPLTVDISKGGGASYGARSMASGTNRLAYNLYQDSGYSTVFGDGTNGTVEGSASLVIAVVGYATVNYPVYGRVFGAQTTLAPGAYADTIAVTLTYY